MLAKYLKPDLLIIDDMGMKQLPKRSGECLFEIVMRRYETRSTIMTSNRPLEDWGKLLGDVPSATAILDRFLHHAEILIDRRARATACETRPRRVRSRSRFLANAPDAGDPKPANAPAGSGRCDRIQNQPSAHRLRGEWRRFKTSQCAHRLGWEYEARLRPLNAVNLGRCGRKRHPGK